MSRLAKFDSSYEGDSESSFFSDSNTKSCQSLQVRRGEDSKKLKFGIDAILSSQYSVSCRSNEGNTCECSLHSTDFHNQNLHYCYQYNTAIQAPMHFYPSLFVSSMPILPAVRRFTNFVIEADKNISNGGTSKRKRIWSRAVFSKLQRKGLEKRFQIQKYIMKPDRKQLAASLGLTDAQVKVWFQNRRMKWRNRKENSTNISSVNQTSE